MRRARRHPSTRPVAPRHRSGTADAASMRAIARCCREVHALPIGEELQRDGRARDMPLIVGAVAAAFARGTDRLPPAPPRRLASQPSASRGRDNVVAGCGIARPRTVTLNASGSFNDRIGAKLPNSFQRRAMCASSFGRSSKPVPQTMPRGSHPAVSAAKVPPRRARLRHAARQLIIEARMQRQRRIAPLSAKIRHQRWNPPRRERTARSGRRPGPPYPCAARKREGIAEIVLTGRGGHLLEQAEFGLVLDAADRERPTPSAPPGSPSQVR